MAHELEIKKGKASMAYTGQLPWHGLGEKIPNNCTPNEMMQAADLDWTVSKRPILDTDPILFMGHKVSKLNRAASSNSQDQVLTQYPDDKQQPSLQQIARNRGFETLQRDSDNHILSTVPHNWRPFQNQKMFDFFEHLVDSELFTMETAGSLFDGRNVWAMVKTSSSFDVIEDDRIDSYLLFSNGHQYGRGINIRFTPIRVVCNNTLSFSLKTKSSNSMKLRHTTRFDIKDIQHQLGIAKFQINKYEMIAKVLTKKKFSKEGLKAMVDISLNGKLMQSYTDSYKIVEELIETQPGATYAQGTWWSAFNAFTHYVDNSMTEDMSQNSDKRMNSLWFGSKARQKNKALEIATSFAQ